MTEADNLRRWQESGDPYRWVWGCAGAWTVEDYAILLADLRAGSYWPMIEDDVVITLDKTRKLYGDLERWHLLGDQAQSQIDQPPASPDDEDVWF